MNFASIHLKHNKVLIQIQKNSKILDNLLEGMAHHAGNIQAAREGFDHGFFLRMLLREWFLVFKCW